jgi:hypothetical protein
MIVGVGPESALATYFGDYIINSESLADAGDDFQDVANYLFKLFYEMNIALLSLTVVMTLGWSTWSHYLNIDAPGKAKNIFYSLGNIFSCICRLISCHNFILYTNYSICCSAIFKWWW